MGYWIGTDEAGYGPKLGPLTIAASLWRVPDEPGGTDLFELLAPWVSAAGPRAADKSRRVWLADSKRIYQPGGLLRLEQSLLACLAASEALPGSVQGLLTQIAADSVDKLFQLPCWQTWTAVLPRAAALAEIMTDAELLTAGCSATGTQLLAVRAKVIAPPQFNLEVTQWENKAELLSRHTLHLIGELLAKLPADDEPVLITCDKHGGRNKYGRFLQEQFPDDLVEVHGEAAQLSLYRWRLAGRRIEARFGPKSEQFLPTAVASLAAKYLRELTMEAFNAFWQAAVPGLPATAGYPEDAKRFWRDIAARRQELGVPDGLLWRSR